MAEVLRHSASRYIREHHVIEDGLDGGTQRVHLQLVREAHLRIVHLDVVADDGLLAGRRGGVPSVADPFGAIESLGITEGIEHRGPVLLVQRIDRAKLTNELESIIELLEHLDVLELGCRGASAVSLQVSDRQG